jgi:hypothetical protein
MGGSLEGMGGCLRACSGSKRRDVVCDDVVCDDVVRDDGLVQANGGCDDVVRGS